MSPEFKKIAEVEIEEFKADYRARFPGRSTDDLRDEDLLREVMNTVGKAGKLGEHVRCVVSVSMLTEGWDANTVTHILGVRAFGTQLLCEQVVGRGLRRMSYAPNDEGKFNAEYAEVYGVPFSFIPCSGSTPDPRPGPTKAVYSTAPEKCHVSHVVADTGSWEQKMAQALEEMPEVVRYVKNQSLGFTIPYTLNGEEKQYYPDFIARVALDSNSAARGVRLQPDLLNLIVEVTDPWDAQRTIRAAVSKAMQEA